MDANGSVRTRVHEVVVPAAPPAADGLVHRPGVRELVARLEALVDELADPAPDDLDALALAEASVRTRQALERLEFQRLAWLSAVEADGRWGLEVVSTFARWVAWSHGTSLSTARREVHLARALRDDLPATAAAGRAGRISSDHARILADVAATTDPRREALARPAAVQTHDGAGPDPGPHDGAGPDPGPDGGHPGTGEGAAATRTGEDLLVALAQSHRPEPFRRIVQHFAALADPDAADRAFADAAEREFLSVAQTLGGFHLAGFLTTEHGQSLLTALDAVRGAPDADDTRTPRQRQAQALADLSRRCLDTGAVGAGATVRPHLMVTVSWSELTALLTSTGADVDPASGARVDWDAVLADRPAAWIDGTGPVPSAVLRRLACDGEVSRIVFGPESEILNVGRRQRIVGGQKRRAVIARDRHCVWGTCSEPPSRCEVHHAVRHWEDGGHTSTDNAALLCWFHHRHVDSKGITMTRTGGRWRFANADGSPIRGRPPRRGAQPEGEAVDWPTRLHPTRGETESAGPTARMTA